MTLPKHAIANFNTLLQAAGNGDLSLIECNDAATGEPRYVLCAVVKDGDGYVFTPFGHLATGDPFEQYLPPGAPGGPS